MQHARAVSAFRQKCHHSFSQPEALWQFYCASAGLREIRSAAVLIVAADHGIAGPVEDRLMDQWLRDYLHDSLPLQQLAAAWKIPIELLDCGMRGNYQSDINFWMRHGSTIFTRKLASGTQDLRYHAALTTEVVEQGVALGRQWLHRQLDQGRQMVVLSSTGSGSANAAAALALAGEWISTGVMRQALSTEPKKYQQSLIKGVRRHPKTHDPYTLLALHGGLEGAVMLGFMLEAAGHNLPVLLDGDYALLIALLAQWLQPHLQEYQFLASAAPAPLYHDLRKKWPQPTVGHTQISRAVGINGLAALQQMQSELTLLQKS